MEKMKSILSIIALVIAVVITVIAMSQTTIYVETVKGKPTIEEYTVLREEILDYAKTLEFNENNKEKIKITSTIKDDTIIITATKEYRCQVKATYPINKKTDGSFEIDYEKGLYESVSKVEYMPMLFAYTLSIIFYRLGIYYVLYFAVWSYMKIKEKVRKKS